MNEKGRYEYNKKYVDKYYKNSVDLIELRLPKGKKENIKEHAKAMGESMNGFINRAINETMKREKGLE